VQALRARLPRVKLWGQVGGDVANVAADNADNADSADDAAAPVQAWDALTRAGPAGLFRAPWSISPDDEVFIYTGGTTGQPKGVRWRQHDLIGARDFGASPLLGLGPLKSPAHAGQRAAAATPRTALITSPLMHGTGFLSALSAMIGGNATAYPPSRRFDPVETWDEAQRLRASRLTIVGDTFCRPLVDALERFPNRWDLSSLSVVFSAGTLWSAPVKSALLRHLPRLKLLDSLGSSESAGMASSLASADAPAATAIFRIGAHCAVFDDDGARVAPGSGRVGKLAVNGHIPLGYHKDPAKSALAFPVWEGRRWSCSGDMASVDADGTVRLVGRGDQCINTGGEKVYPQEVEERLLREPGVRDAAVLGLEDPRLGQRVCAVVAVENGVPAPTLQALNGALRERLAGYKLPRALLVVADLARTPSAKLRYDLLRQWLRAADAGAANLGPTEFLHWEQA
jgi:fatty-acyl-CoA synthase